MKEWKSVWILLGITIVLGIILGIKIINNTPEKQLDEFKQQYEEQVSDEEKTEQQSSIENAVKIMNESSEDFLGLIVICGGIILFYIFVSYRIYYKLGINTLLLKLHIILPIVTVISAVTIRSEIISVLLAIVTVIINIILTIMMYKAIGVSPWLLLLGFIPMIGTILTIIVSIVVVCKLADYFGEGLGFKLGLIFLPFIFLPILAFSAE